MKKRLLNVIGITLIISGLVLLAIPSLTSYWLKSHTQDLNDYTEELSYQDLQENFLNLADFDLEAIDFITPSKTFSQIRKTKINYNQIIGQLVIPSLKLNLTMFNGINNANLFAGVATMKANQIMGERNFALAGHTTLSKGALFTDLYKIQTGSIVRISDKQTIYLYKIYQTAVVSVYDSYLIEDEEAKKHGSPIISLMSCYQHNQSKRFFAFGELIETLPYTKYALEKPQEE